MTQTQAVIHSQWKMDRPFCLGQQGVIKMICENAYYPNGTGENRAKLFCRKGTPEFDGKCPFVYWCQIDKKYENTVDMFDCVNREKNK